MASVEWEMRNRQLRTYHASSIMRNPSLPAQSNTRKSLQNAETQKRMEVP